jgi:pimeloyl-ACP methyl ester carboxylesterase
MTELRTVETPSLRVAYHERGSRDATPVVLVHGFPDDAHTWDLLAEALVVAGYRTIAPYVRGFGETRFLGDEERTGEIAALTRDVLEFADALGLDRFHLVGHDWGARAGYGAATLWPQRLLSLSALAVTHGTAGPSVRLPIEQTRAYWYQWYFATSRGADELETNRRTFCRALWRYWSPTWRFSEDEYERAASSFENPDFVAIVLTSYRERWGFIPGAKAYAAERERLSTLPSIAVPTLVLLGVDDAVTLPETAEGKEQLFSGPYRVELMEGSGHFLPREVPSAVSRRVIEHLRAYDGP